MKQFHVIALTMLLGVAFAQPRSLAPIRGRIASRAALTNPKAPARGTTPERARFGEQVTLHAAGRGRPMINLADGHELLTEYVAASDKLQFVGTDLAELVSQAQPLALTSGDFDEDGVAYESAG